MFIVRLGQNGNEMAEGNDRLIKYNKYLPNIYVITHTRTLIYLFKICCSSAFIQSLFIHIKYKLQIKCVGGYCPSEYGGEKNDYW